MVVEACFTAIDHSLVQIPSEWHSCSIGRLDAGFLISVERLETRVISITLYKLAELRQCACSLGAAELASNRLHRYRHPKGSRRCRMFDTSLRGADWILDSMGHWVQDPKIPRRTIRWV